MSKSRARKARQETTASAATPAGEGIATWTRSAAISRATFYLIPLERRPRSVKIGRRTIILERASEWLERMAALGGVRLLSPKDQEPEQRAA